jgi:hypothetical protein
MFINVVMAKVKWHVISINFLSFQSLKMPVSCGSSLTPEMTLPSDLTWYTLLTIDSNKQN